jgi:transposase
LLHLDHPRSALPSQIQAVLQRALALRDRRARGAVTPHGFAVARGRLLARLLDVLTTTRSPVPEVRRFAAHLIREAPAILTFRGDPAIDATNWRAEHAIRPAVVTRKVCGGNRTVRGAETQQVLASVLRTLDQRGIDPADVFTPLLQARQPLVAPALRVPSA